MTHQKHSNELIKLQQRLGWTDAHIASVVGVTVTKWSELTDGRMSDTEIKQAFKNLAKPIDEEALLEHSSYRDLMKLTSHIIDE